MMTIPGYDAWKLAAPDDGDRIGTEDGEPCNRIAEPDEDAPRGHNPMRCDGTMTDMDGEVYCDVCGDGG